MGDPELVFLDEPTTGFDPSARRGAWEVVASLRGKGKTVLLTTHYMDEAQHLADRVAVMSGGSLVALGPPDQLGGRDTGVATIRFLLPDGVTPDDLPVPVRTRGRRRGVRHRLAHAGAAPPHQLGAGPGDRAARADREPAVARGRLPGAHRRRQDAP